MRDDDMPLRHYEVEYTALSDGLRHVAPVASPTRETAVEDIKGSGCADCAQPIRAWPQGDADVQRTRAADLGYAAVSHYANKPGAAYMAIIVFGDNGRYQMDFGLVAPRTAHEMTRMGDAVDAALKAAGFGPCSATLI